MIGKVLKNNVLIRGFGEEIKLDKLVIKKIILDPLSDAFKGFGG